MEKLKVLVVDDSVVYRKILTAAVQATGMVDTIQTASNGLLAMERLSQQNYDVALIDVYMPELDGMATLKRIKAEYPKTVAVMVSSSGEKGAQITLQALQAGALDFIVKPTEGEYEQNVKGLSERIKLLFAQIKIKHLEVCDKTERNSIAKPVRIDYKKVAPVVRATQLTGVDLIVIAASTGGPVALERVICGLGRDLDKPILIVQHMPPDYTRVLAQKLAQKSGLRVVEGHAGEVIESGKAIVAPGGSHMTVRCSSNAKRIIKLDQGDYVHGVRPSADVLFKSVAREYRRLRILAVVLTGMGNDGMDGVAELKRQCECYCLVQDEASCVVYGMPRSVAEAGLADESATLDQIAERIKKIVKDGS